MNLFNVLVSIKDTVISSLSRCIAVLWFTEKMEQDPQNMRVYLSRKALLLKLRNVFLLPPEVRDFGGILFFA